MASLHDNLLEAAEALISARRSGTASNRRAVSTAYYAVFHRLSDLCARQVSRGASSSEEYRRLYRSLEHKQVRDALNRSPHFRAELGARFEALQDIRHWADYSAAPHPDPLLAPPDQRGKPFTLDEARAFIEKARDAMQFIDELDTSSKHKLAILLLVRDRR